MIDAIVAAAPPTRGARTPRRALHGLLLLDKPVGWTSNDALQKARGLLRAEKAGHTGTLDPLATGLLPLCFGAATKFSHASLDADKRYTATLQLGLRTTTGDREGEVVEQRPVAGITRHAVEAACRAMTGRIDQLPPMHSAIKHEGRALYDYARAGVEVDRKPRSVTVHRIDIDCWQGDTLVIDVTCSKGTYIRTLAEDIGSLLGCGAHLAALRRTACGPLALEAAVTIEALQSLPDADRAALLLPPQALLADWPMIRLPDGEAARFLCGLRRRVDAVPDAPAVRVHRLDPSAPGADGDFLGTAHVTAGELVADRLMSPADIASLTKKNPR